MLPNKMIKFQCTLCQTYAKIHKEGNGIMSNQYANHCTLRAVYYLWLPNKENPIENKSCSLETFYT